MLEGKEAWKPGYLEGRRLEIFRKDIQPLSFRTFLLPSMDTLWLRI